MTKEELLERSETFLRGFFEKGLPVEDLLAGADPVDFSWIGPGEKEFFDNRDALLAFFRQGYTYKEIGELMNISQRTVRYYVNELIHRCRVENRAQLIAAVFPDKKGK